MRNRPAATFLLLPALLAGVVLVLALPGQASAAKPCWERVIDDWLADGRIDGTYSVKCYQQALKNVQEDLRDYSNITDAINASMQDALRKQARSSGGGPSPTPGNTGGNGTTPSGTDRSLQVAPRPPTTAARSTTSAPRAPSRCRSRCWCSPASAPSCS